jgi:hypothetical protein
MLLDIENVDWDAFVLGKSGRAVKLLYNKEAVQFCTSNLYSPFGVKSVTKDWSLYKEYFIDNSLNNSTSQSAVSFRDFIDKLDNKIQQLCKDNVDIFTTNKSTITDDFVYNPMLKENGNYPKLMKLQISRDKNGNFESVIFDENKNKIKLDESNIDSVLSRGKIYKCIIECSKIWAYNGRIGSIWNIVQLKFSDKYNNNKTETEIETETETKDNNVYNTIMID